MIVAIDMGNTNAVIGCMEGEENLPCRRSELVGLEGRIQTGIQ